LVSRRQTTIKLTIAQKSPTLSPLRNCSFINGLYLAVSRMCDLGCFSSRHYKIRTRFRHN
jgi:hypothetical protein